MAAIQLKPEIGTELASALSQVLDGTAIEVISEAYKASLALGDNAITEQNRDKYMKVQAMYNDTLVPAVQAVQASFGEFTDLAQYTNNLQVDTNVKDVDIGTYEGNQYDAARSL